ncbi:MAG: hypothetical protein ACYCO3_04175 [Mycobacteriales bacterium]
MSGSPAKKSTPTAARSRRRNTGANPTAAKSTTAEPATEQHSTLSASTAAVVQAVSDLPGVPDVSTLLDEARTALSALQRRVDQLEASLTALQQARAGAARRRLFGR